MPRSPPVSSSLFQAIATSPRTNVVNLTVSINVSPTIWALSYPQSASTPPLNEPNENKILVSRCIIDYSLGKLYTTAFYKAAARHLSAQGLMVVQSTSPMFARDSYWCIVETLKQAGLQTYPYHVYVPSFGEWGFVIAGHRDFQLSTSLPAGLRFVSVNGLPAMFQFPP